MDQDAVAPRCWQLWFRIVWTAYDEFGELADYTVACQLEPGHAQEHYSKTDVGEIWWGKTE